MRVNPVIWPFVAGLAAVIAAAILWALILRKSRGNGRIGEVARPIMAGAQSYLIRQAIHLGLLVGIGFLASHMASFLHLKPAVTWRWGASFALGALCTALAGNLGVLIATRCNSRTAEAARQEGLSGALLVVVQGGSFLGLSSIGLAVLGLAATHLLFPKQVAPLLAYAFGAALVTFVTRVGGGIYTKAADIGADIVSKAEPGFSQDDARNAAAIADKVGDNLGEAMGLSANLTDSLIQAIAAAIALATLLHYRLPATRTFMLGLPLMVASVGLAATMLGFVFIRFFSRGNPLRGLLQGVTLASFLTLLGAWLLLYQSGGLFYGDEPGQASWSRADAFKALVAGYAAGLLVCFLSDLYTSLRYRATRRIAEKSLFGPVLAVLEGTGLGMRSTALPVLVLVGAIALGWRQVGAYGVALAAFGMLASAGMVILMATFSPIVDNAAGIAEMGQLDRSVRDILHDLNLVGNATAAISKGFATGAAGLAAAALLVAYFKFSGVKPGALSLASPQVLGGLLAGAMLPFFLSSLLFRAVGALASRIIDEVVRQFREVPGTREGQVKPDYFRCVDIATPKALKAIWLPLALALGLPLAVGFGVGPAALGAMLAGSLVSGLALSLQMGTTGSALDSAKKYIEEGYFGGGGSDAHRAALTGDALGDCFQGVIAPSIMVFNKLMCVLGLLIAPLI